jgi:hypothetical protein
MVVISACLSGWVFMSSRSWLSGWVLEKTGGDRRCLLSTFWSSFSGGRGVFASVGLYKYSFPSVFKILGRRYLQWAARGETNLEHYMVKKINVKM